MLFKKMFYAKPTYFGVAIEKHKKQPLLVLEASKKPELLDLLYQHYVGQRIDRIPTTLLFHQKSSRLDVILAFPIKKTLIIEIDLLPHENSHVVLGLFLNNILILSKDKEGKEAIFLNLGQGIAKFEKQWKKSLKPFLLDKWVKKHFNEHENPELNRITDEQLGILKTQMPELWLEIMGIYESDWT